MILEFDCGNTRIKWRIREQANILHRGSFSSSDALDIALKAIPAELVKRILVSSVLGVDFANMLTLCLAKRELVIPEFAMASGCAAGVENGYEDPHLLGVDRWLAILGAKASVGAGFIVVDCGSAMTVDLVTRAGKHLGGYIAPGLRLLRGSLTANTAAIRLTSTFYGGAASPGENTIAAIGAAEVAMMTGLVERAVSYLVEIEEGQSPIVFTGGDGSWLSSFFTGSIYIEDLVLDGLQLALPTK